MRRTTLMFVLAAWAAGCGSAMDPAAMDPGAPAPAGADGGVAPDGAGGGGDLGGAGDDGGTAATPSSGFVAAAGGSFVVDGKPVRLVGVNRYDVASFPPGSGKYACGNAYTDAQIDQMFTEVATSTHANVIRLWAFQSFTLGGTDWTTLDRAVAAARAHGMRVIFTLENEWRDCTEADPASPDGRKSGAWFAGGYKAPLGAYPLSYRDYVQKVVARYAAEPTVAMWQLMNEAESSDAQALLDFTRDMASVIKTLDGKHLLSLGTIGGGQAGTDNANYQALHAVAGIDVVEAHDYHAETVALPGAPSSTSNSIYADLAVARTLGKPFFIGEAGIAAPTPMYPFSYADRAKDMDAKLAAAFDAGASGFLVWSFYDLKTDNHEGWDFDGQDPLAAVLAKYVTR